MNKKGFILLVAIVLIVLWILYKVNTAQRLDFSLGVPQEISLRSGALTFILPVRITNNSSGSIRIKSADFDVLSSGKLIGRALVTSAFTTTPKAVTVMPVSVTIGALDAISAASTIWASLQAGKLNLTLDGLVYAELFQFPVKQSFDLKSDLLKNFTKIF